MGQNIVKENGFSYIETNPSKETLVLLHGLLGTLSNFNGIITQFGDAYNIVFPMLPIFDLPLKKAGLGGLLKYIESFIEYKNFSNINLLGNSLGGHLAQLYTLKHPERVQSLILTGSSGLFENAMGSTFPKRGNYEYIKKKAEDTFYDPSVATKELVDELFEAVNDRNKALRIIITAKSAIRHNLEDKLNQINCPTLLVWGKEDGVTPLFVGEKFNKLIKYSKLVVVEKCGHAPMMERPDKFNTILSEFLSSL
jgi:pimeloyl-ACP methyl ester carboxylesterase